MFEPADANMSVYAEEDCRRTEVAVYYPGAVYEGDARCLIPRLSERTD
jgi:hypothetical protein